MALQIGRFEIRRELGRGAQSIVYLAYDPQLQREIAIKTLHFSHPDAKQNQALLAEAREQPDRQAVFRESHLTAASLRWECSTVYSGWTAHAANAENTAAITMDLPIRYPRAALYPRQRRIQRKSS